MKMPFVVDGKGENRFPSRKHECMGSYNQLRRKMLQNSIRYMEHTVLQYIDYHRYTRPHAIAKACYRGIVLSFL